MKLTLKQIQIVDFLLQELNQRYSYIPDTEQLNLVIKIDNSLWKGNLIKYKDYRAYKTLLDYDSCCDLYFRQEKLFTLPSDFEFKNYRHITLDKMYLLLNELISISKKIDTLFVDLDPVLFNAVNLNSDLKLPYLLLDPNATFEIVSVISTTNECIHS